MTILKSKLDVLIAARELIADEKHWIKGHYAVNKGGFTVEPESDSAVCWCSMGALERVKKFDNEDAELELMKTCGYNPEDSNFAMYNDTHSHAEVLAVWDETIRRVAHDAVEDA